MSESMAGVTFLALGNGSPDLFSTFAAMRVGSGSLAIGELIGAAFFINAVVAGSMAIVRPFKVSRKSFIRDVLFFAGAVGFSVALLANGMITTWESSLMVAYYGIYVFVVVMVTWYWGNRSKKRRTESRARHHYREAEEEIPEAEEEQERNTASEQSLLLGDVRDLEENAIDDTEDQELEREYHDIQHKMSLIRPSIETLRSPGYVGHAPIRPSLFGALEFRSLSSKLASASALHRRHSVAQGERQSDFTLRRNNSDPFNITSAPPQQGQAPWHTPDGRAHSIAGGDYFSRPPRGRPIRSPAIHPIPEDDDDDSKPSPYLLPPQQKYGPKRSTSSPPLQIETSDAALTLPPPQMDPPDTAPSLPLGFRDSQEQDSLSSPKLRRYRWWPYFLLPDPHSLYITLFPALRDFKSKTWFQRFIAVLATPAVFCFTITLPVIDAEALEEENEIRLATSPAETFGRLTPMDPNSSSELIQPITPDTEKALATITWNRWLTGLQCLCAPIFLAFIFSSNASPYIR
jgi:solute carrier family 24 (sodium/potassium/calcium exchanger), member 6